MVEAAQLANMFKVLLKTKNDRYCPHVMQFEDGKLAIYRNEKERIDSYGIVYQSLNDYRICSVDTADKKIMDEQAYCLMFSKEGTHRKIFFKAFDKMQLAIALILEAQGISSRAAQYTLVQDLGIQNEKEVSIVKHCLT